MSPSSAASVIFPCVSLIRCLLVRWLFVVLLPLSVVAMDHRAVDCAPLFLDFPAMDEFSLIGAKMEFLIF